MGTVGSTLISAEDEADSNVVKVVGREGVAVAFFRQMPSSPPAGELFRHVGLYAYRSDFLQQFAAQPASPNEREFRLEQLRALEMGSSIGLVTLAVSGRSIDTPEDLDRLLADWDG